MKLVTTFTPEPGALNSRRPGRVSPFATTGNRFTNMVNTVDE